MPSLAEDLNELGLTQAPTGHSESELRLAAEALQWLKYVAAEGSRDEMYACLIGLDESKVTALINLASPKVIPLAVASALRQDSRDTVHRALIADGRLLTGSRHLAEVVVRDATHDSSSRLVTEGRRLSAVFLRQAQTRGTPLRPEEVPTVSIMARHIPTAELIQAALPFASQFPAIAHRF